MQSFCLVNRSENMSSLFKVSYIDAAAKISISAYSDAVIVNKTKNGLVLIATRISGYPEYVNALTRAINGGGTLRIMNQEKEMVCKTLPKQYIHQFNHDGVYAEATITALDDGMVERDAAEDNGAVKANDGKSPRLCYILSQPNDDDALFKHIDMKTSAPLIPEFKDYLISELQRRQILKPLEVHSIYEKIEGWVLNCSYDDRNICQVVSDGILNGNISLPAPNDPLLFNNIAGISQYLNEFAGTLAENIRSQFEPLFDPATDQLSPEILEVNETVKKNAGYSLYEAQLAAAQALTRRLVNGETALLVAECGTGKTKIGTATLYAYQTAYTNKNKHFNIVMSPAHVAKKWVRELVETSPNTQGAVIRSITQLDDLYQDYLKGNKTVYAIISKEKARDGYARQPAAIWSKQRKYFRCPHCFEKIMMKISDDGGSYFVDANQAFFKRETKENHKCRNCGSMLWTTANPAIQNGWIKVGDFGFVHRHLASQYLSQNISKKAKKAISDILKDTDWAMQSVASYRRYSLSSYINRYYKNKLDGVIVDELHQYNNDSGQGEAMAEIAAAADKVVGMTATLINGYSSGIFHLLYRFFPSLMLQDNKPYHIPQEFNRAYGVTESVYEIKYAEYSSNRRSVKRKVREKQLPGVSPIVYTRFLLDAAVFLTLFDMGKELPEYEEIPTGIPLPEDIQAEYAYMEKTLKDILKNRQDISRRILSAYFNLLTVYPDQPYNQKGIYDPKSQQMLLKPKNMRIPGTMLPKDKKTLEIAKNKVEQGENVLIYVSRVALDSQEKLKELLNKAGYYAEILSSSTAPTERENWVDNRLKSGLKVLITNPSLVETGLDLNAFTTIIFYNISFNLFTLRQASRRSWRINQTAPRVEVYLLYYLDTMQHRGLSLMASKLAAAGIIEGNITDEGLAAMGDCGDLTSQLTRQLVKGIKEEVTDIAGIFKSMAILKSVQSDEETALVIPFPFKQYKPLYSNRFVENLSFFDLLNLSA